ncbi:MAG: response regulator, partial [Deltaproteobacteria bacterium]
AGEEKKTFSAAETLVGSETILVAEDDGDLREILGKLLTNSGYQVLLAVDGQDAVEQYREVGGKIALVIMDMVMPRKSGKEAYEALRKLRPGPKVLFTSGYSSGIKQQLLEVDEYTEFIPKPLRPAELLKKVRDMLER